MRSTCLLPPSNQQWHQEHLDGSPNSLSFTWPTNVGVSQKIVFTKISVSSYTLDSIDRQRIKRRVCSQNLSSIYLLDCQISSLEVGQMITINLFCYFVSPQLCLCYCHIFLGFPQSTQLTPERGLYKIYFDF